MNTKLMFSMHEGLSCDESQTDQSIVKQGLVTAYRTNLECKMKEEVGTLEEHDQPSSDGKGEIRWSTNWWQQFTVLLERGLKERRHESFSGLKIFQVLIVAFISGLIWWHSGVTHLQDQIGLLFFYSGFWGFFPLFEALFTFPQEREMLVKERSSGMYRLSSYFIARIVGDLPMELVLPTIFVIITYFMAGLKLTASNFFETLFVLLYSVLVAQGLGLALGALVMDLKSATTLASVIMLTFLLAGGYYVQHVPSFISWTQYISLPHYSYKLLLGSQYSPDQYYPCAPNVYCKIKDFPGIAIVGLSQKGVAAVALGVMLVGYRLIAYVALTRLGKVH